MSSGFLPQLSGPAVFVPPGERGDGEYGPGALDEHNERCRTIIKELSTNWRVDAVDLWDAVQNWQVLNTSEVRQMRWREAAWEFHKSAEACKGEEWSQAKADREYRGNRSIGASWRRQQAIVERCKGVLEGKIRPKAIFLGSATR